MIPIDSVVGQAVEFQEWNFENLNGFLSARESDQQVARMFDYVRVVDPAAADQIAHPVECHAIGAQRKNQGIAPARVRVRHQDVTPVPESQAVDFGGGVGEVGLNRHAPGLAVVAREGSVQVSAAAVVAEEGHQAAIRQRPPEWLFGGKFAAGTEDGEGLPPIDALPSANEKMDARLFVIVGPARHHPLAGGDFLGREVIDGVFGDHSQIFPGFIVWVQAKSVQFQARPEEAGRLVQGSQRQQLAIALPEATGDPAKSSGGARVIKLGIGSRVGWHGGQELGVAPFQAIPTGGELHPLSDAIFNARPVAPHGPKPAGVMRQVVMLVDAIRCPDIMDDRMLALDSRQIRKINLVRIVWNPSARQHPRWAWTVPGRRHGALFMPRRFSMPVQAMRRIVVRDIAGARVLGSGDSRSDTEKYCQAGLKQKFPRLRSYSRTPDSRCPRAIRKVRG